MFSSLFLALTFLCFSQAAVLPTKRYVTSLSVAVRHISIMDTRATVCNGHPELCGRGYGNTTFLAAHDSFAASKNPFEGERTRLISHRGELIDAYP